MGSAIALLISYSESRKQKLSVAYDLISCGAIWSAFVPIEVRLTPGIPDTFTRQLHPSPIYAALVALALATFPLSEFVGSFLEFSFFRHVPTLLFGIHNLEYWLKINFVMSVCL